MLFRGQDTSCTGMRLPERLEIRFDLGAPAFQKGRKSEALAEFRQWFIRGKSRTIGSKLKQDRIRFAKIEAPKIIAIDLSAIWYAQFLKPPRPGMVTILISNPESDMMDAACARSVRRNIRSHLQMDFPSRPPLAHFVDMHRKFP